MLVIKKSLAWNANHMDENIEITFTNIHDRGTIKFKYGEYQLW